jgi:hypothetical protein
MLPCILERRHDHRHAAWHCLQSVWNVHLRFNNCAKHSSANTSKLTTQQMAANIAWGIGGCRQSNHYRVRHQEQKNAVLDIKDLPWFILDVILDAQCLHYSEVLDFLYMRQACNICTVDWHTAVAEVAHLLPPKCRPRIMLQSYRAKKQT